MSSELLKLRNLMEIVKDFPPDVSDQEVLDKISERGFVKTSSKRRDFDDLAGAVGLDSAKDFISKIRGYAETNPLADVFYRAVVGNGVDLSTETSQRLIQEAIGAGKVDEAVAKDIANLGMWKVSVLDQNGIEAVTLEQVSAARAEFGKFNVVEGISKLYHEAMPAANAQTLTHEAFLDLVSPIAEALLAREANLQ